MSIVGSLGITEIEQNTIRKRQEIITIKPIGNNKANR